MNAQALAARLRRAAKEIPKKAAAEAAIELGSRAIDGLVTRSPVGNPALWVHPAPAGYVPGTFRNSWAVGIGSMPVNTRRSPDASGTGSLAEKAVLGALRSNPYVMIYVANDLPYAWRIEHGWSKQAPAGVVAVTLQSLKVL